MAKHYIRINKDNEVVMGWSDAMSVMTPTSEDILIEQNGANEFTILQEVNPLLIYNGVYRFLYEDEVVRKRTDEEIEQRRYLDVLNAAKKLKNEEINKVCKQMIEAGVTLLIDGVEEHFSYSLEAGDQDNIDDLLTLVKIVQRPTQYHCDDGPCKDYTVAQIYELWQAQKVNKAKQTTYANHLKQYVKTLTTVEKVNKVFYGQELTGEILEAFNYNMNQQLYNFQIVLKS